MTRIKVTRSAGEGSLKFKLNCAIIYVLHVIQREVFAMETVVTSRIDSGLKERVANILQKNGLTTSDAIRQMFEDVVMNNSPTYLKERETDKKEVKSKIARLDSLYVHGYENSTDDELREMRIEDRYASSFRH